MRVSFVLSVKLEQHEWDNTEDDHIFDLLKGHVESFDSPQGGWSAKVEKVWLMDWPEGRKSPGKPPEIAG